MATHEYDRGHSSPAVADPIVGEYRIKYMYVYLYEYGCFVVVVLFCGCILRSIQRVLGMLHAYMCIIIGVPGQRMNLFAL